MSKEHKTKLVIGDWSHDGHCQEETYMISSNLTRDEISDAYEKCVNKIGINLTKDIAGNYENNMILKDDINKFISAGHVVSDEYFKEQLAENKNKEYWLEPKVFFDLYLFTVKAGNSKFKYKIIDEDCPIINIGGYGLFFS